MRPRRAGRGNEGPDPGTGGSERSLQPRGSRLQGSLSTEARRGQTAEGTRAGLLACFSAPSLPWVFSVRPTPPATAPCVQVPTASATLSPGHGKHFLAACDSSGLVLAGFAKPLPRGDPWGREGDCSGLRQESMWPSAPGDGRGRPLLVWTRGLRESVAFEWTSEEERGFGCFGSYLGSNKYV